MSRALVLVGHGSARNPNTRKPVCANVQAIRARGRYDEVRCGLLKEDPHVSITLDRLQSDDVTVVPFFISDGYYTQEVIPREMKLSGALSRVADRAVRYTAAVGSHPLFADLLLRHARDAGWTPADALVVMGHGTPKNPASAANVYLQTDRVRKQLGAMGEVFTVLIDEPPFVTDVWDLSGSRRIFLVPLFIADGWHVTETVPEDLGLMDGRLEKNGRELVMTSAVGTDPGLTDVILRLAEEAEEASA
jgi:sirohydrochlorin cobaltochelatase